MKPFRDPVHMEKTTTQPTEQSIRLDITDLNFFYGPKQAVFGLNLKIPTHKVTALIGPSGCGKSTFLRTLNRMNETIRNTRVEGKVLLDGQEIHTMDVVGLRRRVGMVFQRPNPFPKSIYENVAYGLRVNGFKGRRVHVDRQSQKPGKRNDVAAAPVKPRGKHPEPRSRQHFRARRYLRQ